MEHFLLPGQAQAITDASANAFCTKVKREHICPLK
jgi:hypothetical protein